MSLAPQAEECQQRVDDEIALDSSCLLRKVVHNGCTRHLSSAVRAAEERGGDESAPPSLGRTYRHTYHPD